MRLQSEQVRAVIAARQRLLKQVSAVRQLREKVVMAFGLAVMQRRAVYPPRNNMSRLSSFRLPGNSTCTEQQELEWTKKKQMRGLCGAAFSSSTIQSLSSERVRGTVAYSGVECGMCMVQDVGTSTEAQGLRRSLEHERESVLEFLHTLVEEVGPHQILTCTALLACCQGMHMTAALLCCVAASCSCLPESGSSCCTSHMARVIIISVQRC